MEISSRSWGQKDNLPLPKPWDQRPLNSAEVNKAFLNFTLRAVKAMSPDYLAIGSEPKRVWVRSIPYRIVAHRMPALDQVVLFRAACALTQARKMNMDMSSALRTGVGRADVPLQSLRESPGLGDIDWHPGSILRLSGVNIVGRHRLELGVERVDLVGVLGARLPKPVGGRRGRGRGRSLLVAMKQVS
jgi:hypothetical protein